jgi:hypothetical protein
VTIIRERREVEPTEQLVDPVVLQELGEGENILWWEKPDRRRAIQPGRTSPRLLLFIGICVAILGGIAWLVLPHLLPHVHLSPLVFALLGGCLLIALLPSRLKKRGHTQTRPPDFKHTYYAITDRRIMIITSAKTRTVRSYTREEIGRIKRMERANGSGAVIFGLTTPHTQDSPQSLSSVARFDGIANARQVEHLLLQTFKESSTQVPERQETLQEGQVWWTP